MASEFDLIYGLPSGRLAGTVTQETGITNSLYPVSRAVDGDPARATKSTSTGDYALQWDFGTAQPVGFALIPMYGIPAGTVVQFQLNSSASWPGAINVSVTVPAFRGDLPRGLFFDTQAEGGESGYRYARLFVPNPGRISAIGDIWIANALLRTRNLFQGLEEYRDRVVTTTPRNDGGAFKYDRGTDIYEPHSAVVSDDDAVFADYEELFHEVRGVYRPFPVVLRPTDPVPEGLYMEWRGGHRIKQTDGDVRSLQVSWAMVPRGRAL